MIVAGFGFRAGARLDSLRDALNRAGAPNPPDLLATPADKAATALFTEFARERSLPVHPVPPAELARQQTPTRSAASQAARGTGSVAEAAALAAAGPGARLLAPRTISGDRMATCALAKREDT